MKHDKHDDTRTVVSDTHLETMVVAAVATLKDKNGTNATRLGHWLEAKLVRAVLACVASCVPYTPCFAVHCCCCQAGAL